MKSFKDLFITEMSQEIEDIPKENTKKAEEVFKSYFDSKNLKHLEGDMYLLVSGLKPAEFIVYAVVNDVPVGATYFKQTGVFKDSKEEFAYIAAYTLVWGSYKGFMFKCYSAFSKYKKSYIMSDKKQTQFSKKNWEEWFLSKKNIKEIFCYDAETKSEIDFESIEQSWCKSEDCRRYRIVVKF